MHICQSGYKWCSERWRVETRLLYKSRCKKEIMVHVHDLLSDASISSSSAVSVNHCNTRNERPCALEGWGENTLSCDSPCSVSLSRDTELLSRDMLLLSSDFSASFSEVSETTWLSLPCASAARHILYTSDSFMSLGLLSGVLWEN